MNDQGSLVLFTKAALMLAEANTIQQCQELKSLALTAADWAKHKGAGVEAVKLANSYAYRAEIKMGEMLKATERAPAGRPAKEIGDVTLPITPTLADLGVTKRESSEAQLLASLPPDLQEQVISGEKTKQQVKREFKAQTAPEPPASPKPAPIKATPLPPGPDDRDARIAQLERLVKERDEEIQELVQALEDANGNLKGLTIENEALRKTVNADDAQAAIMAENEKCRALARVTEERSRGVQNRNKALAKTAEMWMNKFKRLEKKVKGLPADPDPEPDPAMRTDFELDECPYPPVEV